MGYTTYFDGEFKISPLLKPEDKEFLVKFNHTRRMGRKGLDPKYGVEGEFFVDAADGDGPWEKFGQKNTPDVIDHNKPPKTQPGLWCQWMPNEDGSALVWDEGEKFYEYVPWIKYLIDKILAPRGYTLNGEVRWNGEEDEDKGIIIVKNNKVYTRHMKAIAYDKAKEFKG